MITKGQQYRYIARRGKLTDRCGQTVTALRCHRVQILVRFPDGHQAHVRSGSLKEIKPH